MPSPGIANHCSVLMPSCRGVCHNLGGWPSGGINPPVGMPPRDGTPTISGQNGRKGVLGASSLAVRRSHSFGHGLDNDCLVFGYDLLKHLGKPSPVPCGILLRCAAIYVPRRRRHNDSSLNSGASKFSPHPARGIHAAMPRIPSSAANDGADMMRTRSRGRAIQILSCVGAASSNVRKDLSF